ncbi:MAG: zinc-dependent metalloprotease family protein [Luteolibacter sp.]
MIEFCLISTDYVYLRDAAILMKLGRVLIRADQAQDPYEADGGDTGLLLPHIRDQWNTTIASTVGTTHDLALVARPGAGGGLAYVGTIATSSRYSADGADSNGDFYVIWRHEAGHNWGSGHYEGGGKPEGPTIMSDNSLSRFSSSELAKIIAHRDTKLSSLDNLGPYPFPLPPRANMDRAIFLPGSPLTVDVLNNDSDSNGEAVSLLSFDATTARGSTLTRSVGTGPNGRDQIIYTPAAGYDSGTDTFSYRITDSTGKTALGYVAMSPVGELSPIDWWKLDETSGSTAANAISGRTSGSHTSVTVNQAGATTVTGKGAAYAGTSSSRTSAGTPSYNTNVLTLTTWVKRNGTQSAQAGVVFSGTSTAGSGLCIGPSNDIQFRWNGAGYKTSPSPALTLPDGVWCLVAMSVSPNSVTVHLRTPDGLQSATTSGTYGSTSFGSTLYFGRDNSSHYFKGSLDDVRVYGATFSADQIESLYQQAVDPPTLAVTSPTAGASVPALAVPLTATVANGNVDSVTFLDGTTTLGSLTDAPYALTVPWLYPGSHSVTARATYGDWGYLATSPAVTFTVQTPPLPVVTIAPTGTPSRSGLISGAFVISRNHPIGAITVPIASGGTAVAGTDYTALPTSITMADGVLSTSVSVNPLATSAPGADVTVTATLQSDPSITVGTPSTATLTIDDHITSIASSAWNVATTWTNNTAAPTTGTQGTGLDYAVAHTVVSNDSTNNSQAMIGKSLRVQSGGILDLYRSHATTLQTITYNLPPLTLQDGSTIRFTAGTGSDLHVIPATVNTSGNTTLLINAGSYDNSARLSGAVAGSGTLNVVCQSAAGAGTYVRTVSVTSANNTYSGNWTVNFTASSTDDYAALTAGAANALGTGTVTVGTRSQLINSTTNGINSLAGVVMNGASSSLILTQPWSKATASLSLTGGTPTVSLGNAASTIGNLSGVTGTINGSGSSSSLTATQTTDATFAGTLGTNLKFTKSGAATLLLTGPLNSALPLTLTNGNLGFDGNTPSIASLTQSGGQLLLTPGTPATPRLALSGGYTRTAGGITITAAAVPELGIPHVLVSYGGSRSGTPPVTFINNSGTELESTVSYGAASNSAITITFNLPDAFPAWAASYGLQGADAAKTADPDGDGLSNLQEMLLGFNPTDPQSRLILSIVSVDATNVHLRLNRVVTTGTFALQRSDTLGAPWIETPVSVGADGYNFAIDVARGGGKRFYRVVYREP